MRDAGRRRAHEWLKGNFDKIGVDSTLDMDRALQRELVKPPTKGAAATP